MPSGDVRALGKPVDEQVEQQLKARISIAKSEAVGEPSQVRESIGPQRRRVAARDRRL